jgi:hypothetical protein
VVVDFRGNPGGNSFQFHYLMMPVLEDTLLTPPGRLLALVDGATFSSASTNVHQLRMTAKVQLIGESPGGLAGGYGEVRPLRLPNSQITVWYASRYFPLDNVLSPDARIDVDREIQPSMADYLGGVDPVLTAALASPGN